MTRRSAIACLLALALTLSLSAVPVAAQSTVVLPQGTYPAGTRTLGPVAVPNGTTAFVLSLDRTNWTNVNVKVALTFDLSLDGGTTWNPHPDADPFPVGLTAEGGTARDKNGNVVNTTTLSAPVPDVTNTNRRVRATLVITGGSLTTSGTLTLIQ